MRYFGRSLGLVGGLFVLLTNSFFISGARAGGELGNCRMVTFESTLLNIRLNHPEHWVRSDVGMQVTFRGDNSVSDGEIIVSTRVELRQSIRTLQDLRDFLLTRGGDGVGPRRWSSWIETNWKGLSGFARDGQERESLAGTERVLRERALLQAPGELLFLRMSAPVEELSLKLKEAVESSFVPRAETEVLR
jgi:hypothetical protein